MHIFQQTISQADMHYRDERALELLRASANPYTNMAGLTLIELSRRLECHINTTTRITDRLQGAGYIKKHRTRGRGGAEIEVLCRQLTSTSYT